MIFVAYASFSSPRLRGEGADPERAKRVEGEAGEGLWLRFTREPLTRLAPRFRVALADLSPQAGRGVVGQDSRVRESAR